MEKVQLKSKLIIAVLIYIFCTPVLGEELTCLYVPKSTKNNPHTGFTEFYNCGAIKDDILNLNREDINRLDFAVSPATVYVKGNVKGYVDGAVFYVLPSGKTIRAHPIDNGADPFIDGLARGIKAGKYGFFNKDLNFVIEPRYDFVFPFRGDSAVVCSGCIFTGGEYSRVIGGKWGAINLAGEVLIPLEYSSREEIEKKIFQGR